MHDPVILGSPVKGEDLQICSKKRTNLDDPRPVKYRKMAGYNDFVRNQV